MSQTINNNNSNFDKTEKMIDLQLEMSTVVSSSDNNHQNQQSSVDRFDSNGFGPPIDHGGGDDDDVGGNVLKQQAIVVAKKIENNEEDETIVNNHLVSNGASVVEPPPSSSTNEEIESKRLSPTAPDQKQQEICGMTKKTGNKNEIRIPFPLLAGEHLECTEINEEYSIYLSNYRFYVHKKRRQEETSSSSSSPITAVTTNTNGNLCPGQQQQSDQLFCIPINNIDSVEMRDLYFLIIYTKHIESFVLTFRDTESVNIWHKRLSDIQQVNVEQLFCFRFFSSRNDSLSSLKSNNNNNNHRQTVVIDELLRINKDVIENVKNSFELMENEYKRMKFSPKDWRICRLNEGFKFCKSYPEYFIVPNRMSDKELESVAEFRYSRRIPAVVWRSKRNGCVILRSSQPVVGWLGSRNREDELMLQNILKICVKDTQKVNEATKMTTTTMVPNGQAVPVENGDLKPTSNGIGNGYRNGSVPSSTGDNLSSQTSIKSNGACPVNGDSHHFNHSIENLDENSSNKLLILDARSYTAAFANRAMGGGCECPEYYANCDVQFMGLTNIHGIRKSVHSLRYICEVSQIDQSNWFTLLDNTKWLHNLASLLKAATVVVDAINVQERPVLVHCSDGWDRTPQVIALAELMLDPYYRTLDGFRVLIEKEWLQFGHKFADRCRSSSLNIDPNEKCPVFLQWLDCVHQLVQQFPREFEFNMSYLIKLVHHSFSCLFGTFTCNNVQERVQHQVYDKTISLWSYLELNKNNFVNYLFLPKQEVLRPSFRVKDIRFWNEIYVPISDNTGYGYSPVTAASIISCNGICYPSNNPNGGNDDLENLFTTAKGPGGTEFDCQHEIQCQSQSKCDLNRSASYESLYNCDLTKYNNNNNGKKRQERDSSSFVTSSMSYNIHHHPYHQHHHQKNIHFSTNKESNNGKIMLGVRHYSDSLLFMGKTQSVGNVGYNPGMTVFFHNAEHFHNHIDRESKFNRKNIDFKQEENCNGGDDDEINTTSDVDAVINDYSRSLSPPLSSKSMNNGGGPSHHLVDGDNDCDEIDVEKLTNGKNWNGKSSSSSPPVNGCETVAMINTATIQQKTLFDVEDGQMIVGGGNGVAVVANSQDTQKELEQLINYHKRMIRCLTNQLRPFKKKN